MKNVLRGILLLASLYFVYSNDCGANGKQCSIDPNYCCHTNDPLFPDPTCCGTSSGGVGCCKFSNVSQHLQFCQKSDIDILILEFPPCGQMCWWFINENILGRLLWRFLLSLWSEMWRGVLFCDETCQYDNPEWIKSNVAIYLAHEAIMHGLLFVFNLYLSICTKNIQKYCINKY